MSTRANVRLISFCMFLILAMLTLSATLIFTAGTQDIESLISIEFMAEKVKLNFANYDGTVVTPGNCDIVLNDDKTKFKIVGPTPIIEGSTSTQSSGPTGKVSSIDDLTNSSGAEFYYFCTNPAVVGSTSFNDPGVIYYTSTADSTLESWYDMPTSDLNLYACFMVPNYSGSGERYTGSDTTIIISNRTTELLQSNIGANKFYTFDNIDILVIPQSVLQIKYPDYYLNGAIKKVYLSNSLNYIEGLTSGPSAIPSLYIVNLRKFTLSLGYYLMNSYAPRGARVFYKNLYINNVLTRDVYLGGEFEYVNDFAFYGSLFDSLTISKNVKSVAFKAFYYASSKFIYEGSLDDFKMITNYGIDEKSAFDANYGSNVSNTHDFTVITTDYPDGTTLQMREFSCLSLDTEITCYDEKRKRWYKKKLRDLTYRDKVVVWNFDEGKFDTAEPIFLTKEQVATRYTVVKLSDGAVLKLIGENDSKRHRMFIKETGRFDYVNKSLVGKTTFNEKGEFVKVLSVEYVNGEIEFANIITKHHFNCFANGILTSCRLSNMYKVQDMKYIKDNRELRPISDFKGVEEKYYDGLRLAEQPYNICRDQGDTRYIDYVDFVNSWKSNSK